MSKNESKVIILEYSYEDAKNRGYTVVDIDRKATPYTHISISGNTDDYTQADKIEVYRGDKELKTLQINLYRKVKKNKEKLTDSSILVFFNMEAIKQQRINWDMLGLKSPIFIDATKLSTKKEIPPRK